MKLKLIEDPLFCSTSNTRKTGETKRADEELLQSWHAVLTEYAPRERAGSQW
jgi:hypothetical protein